MGSAVETIEGVRLIKQRFPRTQDGARHLQRLLRPAAAGPRGAELGLPLPLRPGRPGLALVNSEKLERYPSLPDEEQQALRGPPLQPRRGSRRRRSPRTSASASRRSAATSTPAARGAAAALHHRGQPGRAASTTSTLALQTHEAARDHQRPADEGHGRGGAALQHQRAHRRRGAAERRGDEGRGRAPRAVHGQGRDRHARARCCSPR